ncbi:MAG: flagellar hook-length control protein FliK [Oscillospiraceae bacterium]|jgi:hypothetical protein|nr:flagellar hook-length control protein FliK [Oscillospiraceae bacterium]
MPAEPVQNSQPANQPIRVYYGKDSGNAVNNAVQAGDAFAQIFALLAQPLQPGGASTQNATGMVAGQTAGTQQTGSIVGKGKTLMEQLAGALLAQNPQFAAFVQADDKTAQQMISNLQLPADVQQMLMNMRTALLKNDATQTVATATNATAGTQTAQQNDTATAAIQEGSPAGQQQAAAETVLTDKKNDTTPGNGQNTSVTGAVVKDGSAAEETAPLQAGNQFLQNVRAAKKMMDGMQKQQGQDTKPGTVDVDALQSHARTFQPEISAAALKAAGQTQEQTANLTSQIKAGIADNLLQGKQDFIIKLKPDGLGEITVKLSEKAGEATTLHLMTANSETARLINNDLDALRDAMKPLQVVVESAQSQQTGNGTEQTGQQFGQQQQYNMFDQQHGGRHSHYHYQFAEDTAAADNTSAQAAIQNESELDSYI